MIIVYGRRMYGQVDSSGPTSIRTQFVHIWYLPLFPIGSYLVVGETAGGARTIRIPMHGVSVLAAYLRVWGLVGAVSFLIAAATSDGIFEALPALVVGLLLGVAGVVAWVSLGRLSREGLAQRESYARQVGYPIDVALIASQLTETWHKLQETVASRAHELMGGSYRTAFDPKTQWDAIALDPTVVDRPFLEACLTLARLEWANAQGPERARFAEAHRKLWKKIREQGPSPALAAPA